MVMPLKAKYKDELLGCETKNEIQLNVCSGGCGPTAGLCCKPSVYEYHEESMVYPNGETNVKAKVTFIEVPFMFFFSLDFTPH